MKRVRVLTIGTLVALLTLLSTAPLRAICWGSLYVASKTVRYYARCPNPTLTKTWRIRCYDGCGYNTAHFLEDLSGYGECFQGSNCTDGITCRPLSGIDIYGYNPPSLSSAIVNRAGYYAIRPCQLPGCTSVGVSTISVYCDCDADMNPRWCADNDPIVVSLVDAAYRLTDREGGVMFDLGDIGVPGQVPWTHAESDEAFLALDRDGNGTIDNGRELFGDVTPQHPTDAPNGFLALALYDDALSGGNEDGRISRSDDIFSKLRLWRDRNHNGFSEADELATLDDEGLEWIDLDYGASGRRDRHGNEYRYFADAGWSNGATRKVWNVFLVAD